MDIRVIDPLDEALVRRHWEISWAADADRPYVARPPWESAWAIYRHGRHDRETVLLGAWLEDGVMWGAGEVSLPRHDNLHSALSSYWVQPERRRRGIGSTLAEASYDVARSRGRRMMQTEAFAPVDGPSPGLLFTEAMGFTTALVSGMKLVDLDETEKVWDGLEADVAPRHADYRLVTWSDHVPERLVADYCRLLELFIDEAPMGELDIEAEKWDEQRVRAGERDEARRGRHSVGAGALAPDGTLVGFTEVRINEFLPAQGFQSGTLVAPGHRGHALGLAVKIANHRQLRERFPRCRVLVTGNADVNAPMNAVNDALGYREVERCIEMQRQT